MQKAVLLIVSLSLFVGLSFCDTMGCLDQNGNNVDWWVMFKVPYLPDSSDPVAASGYAYAYADVHSPVLTVSLSFFKKKYRNNLCGLFTF